MGGFALSACSGSSSATSAPAASASGTAGTSTGGTASSPAGSSTGGTTSTGGNGGGSTPTTGTTGTTGTSGTTTSADTGRCHTTDLGYSWATGGDAVPNGNAEQQQTAVVILKNTSGHTCTMHGFPGVDLVNNGTQWPLTRSSQQPSTLTLHPGDSTQFTVTFLPWTAEGNVASNDFAPSTLVITPPDETTSYDLPWRWGHVLLQDGATHPGTFISPVGD
jgi:hypothetical protein